MLRKPVVEFLQCQKALSRSYATVLNARLNRLRAFTVPVGATLGELLNIISETRVHRVYVIDKNFKPVGIITLTDVLAALLDRSDGGKCWGTV